MTDLIPRDAAIAALDSHAHGTTTLGGQTYRSITLEVAFEALHAIPTIDPAAIREAALKEAAAKCAEHAEAARKKLGAAQTRKEAVEWALIVTRCDLLEDAILALIGEKK